MAQPGVAREPSMEEILASIRRIIESNEPETTSSELAQYSTPFDDEPVEDDTASDGIVEMEDEIHLTIEDDLPSFAPEIRRAPPQDSRPPLAQAPMPQQTPARTIERSAPIAEARTSLSALAERTFAEPAAPVQDNQPVPRREEETRSISLADVAARVRAASDRMPADPVRQPASPPQSGASRTVELRAAPSVRAAEQQPLATAEKPSASIAGDDLTMKTDDPQIQAAPEAGHAEVETARRQIRMNDGEDSFARARPVEPSQAPPEVVTGEQEAAKALVSPAIGDQVARSFHELAELVNSTVHRSVDEVAEDLLRPMLQEWLDDNLPTLVERLVREEIERVARGPRR